MWINKHHVKPHCHNFAPDSILLKLVFLNKTVESVNSSVVNLTWGKDSVKTLNVTQSLTFVLDVCDAPVRHYEAYWKLPALWTTILQCEVPSWTRWLLILSRCPAHVYMSQMKLVQKSTTEEKLWEVITNLATYSQCGVNSHLISD